MTAHIPTAALLQLADYLADLVAERVVERLAEHNSQATDERWISADDVAALLSLDAKTARRYLRDWDIQPVKLGGVLRYRASEVLERIAREAEPPLSARVPVTRLVPPGSLPADSTCVSQRGKRKAASRL